MKITEKIVVVIFLAGITVVYALEILFIVIFAVNKLGAEQTANIFWRTPAIFVHLLAIIGVICFLYSYFIEPYWMEVKTMQIQTEKLSKTSFRLIHISDLHCDRKPRSEKRLIELINSLRADIIVFTGDTLRLNTPEALPLFKETMKSLKANLAKFAVYGNIDICYLPNLDFFGGTGFEVLDRKTVKLQKNGETFYISGLNCKYPSGFHDLLKDVPDSCFSIFLYHYSDLVEDLKNLNVDLYLAGHTHGGQIALPIYGALITLSKFGKKYESGMYTVDDAILYVNRGIGGHASAVRFFARPEITVFEVGPKRNQAD